MMLRKHGSSIVLTVLAIVLGLYVWIDRGSITDTERERRSRNVFPAYRKDDVVGIELHGEKGDIVLSRAGDAGDSPWELQSPIKERADSHAVDTLLGSIEFATRVRKAPDDSVGTPRVTGKIEMGAVHFDFALGPDAPTPKGAAYFRVEGEGTFVVGGELAQQLLQDSNAYRSRTVVPYLSIDLQKMSIRDPSGKGFGIERTDDVGFKLDDGTRASRDGLDRVWLALSDLRASTFLSDADADKALAPAITIEMTPKDASKAPGKLQVGGACPSHPEDVVLVRTSPTRASACVPKGLIERLRAEPSELSDRRLFLSRLDEVESIRLASDKLEIDLARKGGGWMLRSPETRELASDEAEMATSLVGAIAHAEGGPSGTPFEKKGAVTITRVESHVQEVVEFDGNKVRRADGVILSIAPELARKFVPSLVAFRGRTIWNPSVENAKFTSLVLDCDGIHQELAHDKTWTYVTPAKMPADDAAAIEVAETIARIKPDAWVAENDDGSFGFDKSKCTASLGVEGRTVKLFFGKIESTGVYARAEGQNPVFLAPRQAREAAAHVLVDRGALAIDPNAVEKVVIEKGGARFVLQKSSGKLASPDGGTNDLVDRVAHAISLLRGDDAVHFGPPTADEGPKIADVRVTANGKETVLHVLRATLRRDQKMYFANIDGVDATFAIAKERVEPLLDPFVR